MVSRSCKGILASPQVKAWFDPRRRARNRHHPRRMIAEGARWAVITLRRHLMTAVASEGVAGTRHELRQRLRSTVLGPHGGGTTRRRASDAFRLAVAVIVVLASIPVMRANSAAELAIVRVVYPPPAAISWLVTSVFWLGS